MPVRPLCPELAEIARLELGEDPKKLEDGIQHLREWIAKQPHLRARTDDQWLATFLRGCKFSMEKAKQKIDLYYSMRTIAPELKSLKPRDPKFIEILKKGIVLTVPKTEKPGDPRLMIMRNGAAAPNQYSTSEFMSVASAVQEIMYVEDDDYIVAGGIQLVDFKDSTMANFINITPVQIKKIIVQSQDAAPIRMKGAHYFNMPTGFETFIKIIKIFLNEKNRNRLFAHGKDYEAMYKHVSKDILPVEYGGNNGTVQDIIDYWVKKVEEYREWFDEDEQFGTDESKRPGKPKSSADLFGIEGSFRQLAFD